MFAEQSGIPLIYLNENVRNKRTNRVAGSYTASEALEILLGGTGIDGSFNERRVLTVTVKESGDDVDSEFVAEIDRTPEGKGDSVKKRGLFAALIAALAGSAVVDVNADQTSEAETRPTRLEEVKVTATKREERLLDAPQSISVLSAVELERSDATQLRDIAGSIPGLTIQSAGAGWTQVSLRGITAGFDVSPTVGIYVDDVPYGSTTSFARSGQLALDVGLFDLERIEVLRGPQGTLYGASTMGGLIKYVTEQPDPDRFTGSARGGVSSTEDGGVNYNLSGVLNIPVDEGKAALRLSGFETHDDGYVDNVSIGVEDVNRSDIYGGRVDLLLAPTDQLSLRLTALEQRIESDGFPLTDRTLAGAPVNGDLGQARPSAESFDQRFRLFASTVTYDFGPAELTSITSYQRVSTGFEVDISAVLLGFAPPGSVAVSVTPSLTETDKFTQELRLSSNPGSGSIDWLLGGFYTHEDSNDGTGLTALDAASEPTGVLLVSDIPSTFSEYALFGDMTWRPTEKFDVTTGIRYAHYSDEFAQIQSGPFGISAPAAKGNDDVFTYLAVARYHFSQDAMAYLRYATGYRPGGPNFRVASAPTAPTSFRPDELESYEAGFKLQSADRRFGLDASIYHIDWNDVQVTVSIAGFAFRDNATGGATSRGADLTLRAYPTDGLSLSAALGYQDAYMNEDTPALRATAGEPLPNVPEFSGALSADYEFVSASLRPTIGATVRHLGDRTASYDASTSPPQYQLDAYTTVDLRAGISLGRFDLRLLMNNLFDERGEIPPRISGSTPAAGPYAVGVIQPRTIGLSLTANF